MHKDRLEVVDFHLAIRRAGNKAVLLQVLPVNPVNAAKERVAPMVTHSGKPVAEAATTDP